MRKSPRRHTTLSGIVHTTEELSRGHCSCTGQPPAPGKTTARGVALIHVSLCRQPTAHLGVRASPWRELAGFHLDDDPTLSGLRSYHPYEAVQASALAEGHCG